MGLYISHMDTVSIKGSRSLYIYLLDYGWPEGEWEQIFKKHFIAWLTGPTRLGLLSLEIQEAAILATRC